MAVKSFWIEMTETAYSVANNTSTVKVAVKISTDSYTYNSLSPSGTITWGGLWASSPKTTFSHSFAKSATTTLYSWSGTVTHNSDGTGKVSASASFATGVSAGTVTATKTLTLTTIPRASQPSVSGTLQLGSAITVSTNRKSSSFTHTLAWAWAGKSGTIATGVGASATWTPAIATFAPYLTTAASASCTVTCTTYSGSTSVGSKTVSFTLSVPASVVPTISAVSLSDPAGLLAQYGAYVQGKSRLQAAATAAGAYGSTISSTTVSVDSLSGTGAVGPLPTAGDRTVKVTVKDSRGRTASATRQIAVAAYAAPKIVTARALRWSGDAEDDESETVRVSWAGAFSDVNSSGVNAKAVAVRHRPRGSSAWTSVDAGNASYAPEGHVDLAGFATSAAYDFAVDFTDSFSTSTAPLTVTTSRPTIDFLAGGEGMAFGKVASAPGLDVAMDALFEGEAEFSGAAAFRAAVTHDAGVTINASGAVTARSQKIDLSAAAPSSTQYDAPLRLFDAAGDYIAVNQAYRTADDKLAFQHYVRRLVNGTAVINQITPAVAADGTMSYTLGSAAAFRSTLGISDYVTASGTSGSWFYIKWANGLAFCTRRLTGSWTWGSAWGNVYYNSGVKGGTAYPFTFTAAPTALLVLDNPSGAVWATVQGNGSTTAAPQFWVVGAGKGSEAKTVGYTWFVFGKWK